MKFVKGMDKPKGSGRKQGTPNKKRILKVEEILSHKGINPTEEILREMEHLLPSERVKVWTQLIAYVEPKQTLAITKEDKSEQNINAEDLSKMTDKEFDSAMDALLTDNIK